MVLHVITVAERGQKTSCAEFSRLRMHGQYLLADLKRDNLALLDELERVLDLLLRIVLFLLQQVG